MRRDLRSYRRHHLVHLHVIVRGLEHRLLHLGQRLRAGDDGERAAGVQDGPDTDLGKQIVCRGTRTGRMHGRGGLHQSSGGE